MPTLEDGLRSPSRCALRDSAGAWTYGELAATVAAAAARLGPLRGERIGWLLERTRGSIAAFLGILEAGGIAVPFSARAAPREIAGQIADAEITRIVSEPAFETVLTEAIALARPRGFEPGLVPVDPLLAPGPGGEATGDRGPAVILTTSGTTGEPKGVVHTHESLASQVEILHRAWEWSAGDVLRHILPLHHVHGLVNGVLGALRAGAELRLAGRFDPAETWRAFAAREATVFYAVPTIYHQLADAWEREDAATRRQWAEGAAALRLAVSGSAALPARLWTRWREITGQALLERYGMTEIGMALSNPYRGERRAGTVGRPLPGMDVRIVAEDGGDAPAGTPGEIRVRGPSLFREYWKRPEATRASFEDGWFRTGDVASVRDGYVVIEGRASVDIIKSGGYKLSALEIEAVLAEHPAIREAAVVGAPDPEWGEVVTACVLLRPGASLAAEDLRAWCRDKLASYKIPRRLVVRSEFPRNAMGKVLKPALRRELES